MNLFNKNNIAEYVCTLTLLAHTVLYMYIVQQYTC